MIQLTKTLWTDTRGATSLEYALLGIVLSVSGVVALNTLGDLLNVIFARVLP